MREMSASEPLVTPASELELHYCSRKSVAETYLLATRCPVYRRHDSHSGSCTELENLSGDAKGKGTSSETARPKVPMRQARLREASESEPSMKCRKRIRRCRNRG